jgi:eukaryotic-like serine/threonine-protein kinase
MQACLQPTTNHLSTVQTDKSLPAAVPSGSARYTQMEPLGSGGMAAVYLCQDEILNRRVAMKVLRDGGRPDGVEERRFLREARVLAALRHPSIPIIYDLGRDATGCPFIITDVLVGTCLRSVLSGLRRGDAQVEYQFPLERLLRIMISVCEAVEFAHRHGVIHRDIKPEHIHIASGDRVTLLDWGLAKLTSENLGSELPCANVSLATDGPSIVSPLGLDAEDARLTRQGQLPGTPLYMSPEQVQDTPALDQRTDIYSIGAVLYDCLVLDTLVSGYSVGEIFRSILAGAIRRPTVVTRRRHLNAELEKVCLRAVARDPAERFPTAAQLGAALHDCQLTLLTEFERNLDRVSQSFNFGRPAAADDGIELASDNKLSAGKSLPQPLAAWDRPLFDAPVPFGQKETKKRPLTNAAKATGRKLAKVVKNALGRKRD